jgi:aminoglycoside phosphotransferase family enzyme
MVENLHEFVDKINNLAVTPKQLSPEAVKHLARFVHKYQTETGDSSIENIIPIMVNYVYNEAYVAATQDILKILRE